MIIPMDERIEIALPTLKKFVSQNEIEEARRIRQAAWDRVRKPEDPKEKPEPEIGAKSLFERLKEQKDKKDADWEETRKYKNQIRGIDDEEYSFLDRVAEEQRKQLRDIEWEVRDEIENFKDSANKLLIGTSDSKEGTEDPVKRLNKILNPYTTDSGQVISSISASRKVNSTKSLKNLIKTRVVKIHKKGECQENNNNNATILSDPPITVRTQETNKGTNVCCPPAKTITTVNALASLSTQYDDNDNAASEDNNDSDDSLNDGGKEQVEDHTIKESSTIITKGLKRKSLNDEQHHMDKIKNARSNNNNKDNNHHPQS